MARFFVPQTLAADQILSLPANAARHVQVLRLQPGQEIILFNGSGGQWLAQITAMGRSDVQVRMLRWQASEREPVRRVHMGLGMPANERMDWLVEKATELGVQRLSPVMTERSVLRLQGDRADKKLAHWQSVVIAASEQCGRNRLMVIEPVRTLTQWLRELATTTPEVRTVLSLSAAAQPLGQLQRLQGEPAAWLLVSGPEGGLSAAEESTLIERGLRPVSLGQRVLRAETAAIAAVTRLVLP